jgi:predicted ribosome quality control (RQC) complex YloA/Tae2 family protein
MQTTIFINKLALIAFMVEVILDINKSVEKNAEVYYDLAKKAKRRFEGAEKALLESAVKLEQLKKEKDEVLKKVKEEEKEKTKPKPKKEWYEKFRWFITSGGFLAVGGRDATTNEIVIKKHTDKDDVVFHTDIAGSPFFVIKSEGKPVDEESKQETAQATASYSKAWKANLSNLDVFYVSPEQVSKQTEAGEYMGKGSFMVRGKKTYLKPVVNIAVGITKEGKIVGGPVSAVKKNCEKHIVVIQGSDKASDAAKKIKKLIGGELDEIIRALPAGGVKLAKQPR